MIYEEFATRVLRENAPDIIEEQRQRVLQYYNQRTGRIDNALDMRKYRVDRLAGGAILTFDYMIDLRFLDIKFTATGRKKRIYGPVYNKPLWGYVYNYIFATLRYGLNEKVRNEIFDDLRLSVELLQKPK